MAAEPVHRSWEEFLDPDVLRPRLLTAAIYIALFETMQDQLVERVKSFYTFGFDQAGPRVDPKYQTDVRARNRSETYACLDWLKESGAIDAADIQSFEQAKRTRNDLAHALLKQVARQALPPDLHERLASVISLLHKTEVWWVKNVELATDPDFDGKEVKDEDITPGMTMMARLLVDVALGSEEQSRFYIDEFKKRFDPRRPTSPNTPPRTGSASDADSQPKQSG